MPRKHLILLAIEDEQVLHLFERALTAGSYLVAIVRDRTTLEKELQISSPALLVLSQNLEGHSGLNAAAEIIERFPTLPVLLFTEIASIENLRLAMRIGVRECIFPPLRINDISRAVEDAIKFANRIGDWTRREIKKTTNSLQQKMNELQKFDTIIQQIDTAIIILDEKLDIVSTNPSARRIFGIASGEKLSARNYSEIINSQDMNSFISRVAEIGNQQQEIILEDGRVYSAQCTPVHGIGKVITMQDISYLRKMDKLKNELVNTVSHDLRSPLSAVMGYVEMLEKVGPLNDQQREFVLRTQNSINSINALINSLLIMGNIEAGNENQNEKVSLDGIVQLSLDTFYYQILEKHLRIIKEWPEIIPQICGNSIRLRQMADNLLGNAIRYTPEDGIINIQMKQQENSVLLSVSDNGPGIPPADKEHIFEKFYQAGNVPKGIGGSGLGLAIVKSIVEQHRGQIWVESALGKGATFYVLLPFYQPH